MTKTTRSPVNKDEEGQALLLAGQAQNGSGFTIKNMPDIMKKYTEDGQIDWEGYYEARIPKMDNPDGVYGVNIFRYPLLDFKAWPGNFDTGFMAQRYINNIRELQAQGEPLPEGITEADLNYADCVVNRIQGAEYNCVRS